MGRTISGVTAGIPADALLGEPVDAAAELVRVLARNQDLFTLRQALSRFAGGATLVVGPEASDLLVAATSVLPDAEVVKRAAPGQRREIDPGVLRDDASVRVLFALMACGCLVTATAGEAAAPAPATTVADSASGTVLKEVEATEQSFTSTNLYDLLLVPASVKLDEANVPSEGRWIVLPPWAVALIKKSDLRIASLAGDGVSILRNGKIGEIDRFTVYQSRNLLSQTSPGQAHYAMFGHSAGLTFAAQVVECEMIQNPNDFGYIVRGLMVYGFQVVGPKYVGTAVIKRG